MFVFSCAKFLKREDKEKGNSLDMKDRKGKDRAANRLLKGSEVSSRVLRAELFGVFEPRDSESLGNSRHKRKAFFHGKEQEILAVFVIEVWLAFLPKTRDNLRKAIQSKVVQKSKKKCS
jgi:hypothetical protein